jgi:hypothetical protein
VDWLTRGWDQAHYVSAAVGAAAALALVLLGWSELAVVGAPLVSVGARWAFWQIPPPGRSRAPGTPPDGWSRLGQLAVAVLIFTLVATLVAVPFR